MCAIGTKSQAKKITLVRFFAKAVFRKIRHLICLQVENGDGLLQARFDGAESIVEQRGVPAVGTQRNCFREAVGTLRRAGSRLDHRFAGREPRALSLLVRSEPYGKNGTQKQKHNSYSSGQAASSEP